MGVSAAMMTVAQFRDLPDPPGRRLELHNGEVAEVSRKGQGLLRVSFPRASRL